MAFFLKSAEAAGVPEHGDALNGIHAVGGFAQLPVPAWSRGIPVTSEHGGRFNLARNQRAASMPLRALRAGSAPPPKLDLAKGAEDLVSCLPVCLEGLHSMAKDLLLRTTAPAKEVPSPAREFVVPGQARAQEKAANLPGAAEATKADTARTASSSSAVPASAPPACKNVEATQSTFSSPGQSLSTATCESAAHGGRESAAHSRECSVVAAPVLAGEVAGAAKPAVPPLLLGARPPLPDTGKPSARGAGGKPPKLDKQPSQEEVVSPARTARQAHSSSRNDDICRWVGEITGMPRGDQAIEEWLKDGQVLCALVNTLRPGSVKKVHKSSAPFKQMENITLFAGAARELGVPDSEMFGTPDLYEAKNIQTVLNCLFSLGCAVQVSCPSFKGPQLGIAMTAEAHADSLLRGKRHSFVDQAAGLTPRVTPRDSRRAG